MPRRAAMQSHIGCFSGLWGARRKGEEQLETVIDLDPVLEANPFMLQLPPICTATLYTAASPPEEYLRGRVQAIVAQNPWLLGRLRQRIGGRAYLAVPRHGPSNSFVVKDLPVHAGMDCQEIADVLMKSGVALRSGWDSLNRDQPLFQVTLTNVGAGRFLLVMALCHAIADGHTFYQIWGMLDPSAHVFPMDVSRKQEFAEAAATATGRRQFNWLLSWPALFGVLRTCFLWRPPKPVVKYVNLDWVEDQKIRCAQRADVSFVSTNDILTSHLLTTAGIEFGYMSINLRNRGLCDLSAHHAGNYVHRVHFWAQEFVKPEGVRHAIASSPDFCRGRQDTPGVAASLCVRHGIVSNWASLYRDVTLPGDCQQVVHMPVVPYPLPGYGGLLIFRPTRDTLAVHYAIRNKRAMQDLNASPVFGPAVSLAQA